MLHGAAARLEFAIACFTEAARLAPLQTEIRASDECYLHRLVSHDLRDFADTAAVMELLDLVISVDTAVAHLAGTQSARLFRQRRAGAWDEVVARITRELTAYASEFSETGPAGQLARR